MATMPRPPLPHLHRERNRHGVTVWYVRVGKGPRVRIRGEYGSQTFISAYEAAVNGKGPSAAKSGPAQGTFAWAVNLYRQSQAWGALASATRVQRESVLRPILDAQGHSKLSAWRAGDIVRGRDKRAARPSAARHFVATMRAFFQWAVEAGLVKDNPTAGVKIIMPRTEGYAAWTRADVAAYRQKWLIGTKQRVAFEVLFGTGLRRGDATRVGRPHLRDGVIRITTEKTGERVAIAVGRDLAAALAAGPTGDLTFIALGGGGARKKTSFGNVFREWCSAAGVTKSAHGLRKLAATEDAEAGWSDAELDAKYGWRGRKMASLYTATASRERLSLAASARTETRTNSPAPDKESAGDVEIQQKKTSA